MAAPPGKVTEPQLKYSWLGKGIVGRHYSHHADIWDVALVFSELTTFTAGCDYDGKFCLSHDVWYLSSVHCVLRFRVSDWSLSCASICQTSEAND